MQDLQTLKLILEQSSMVFPHGVTVFNTGRPHSLDFFVQIYMIRRVLLPESMMRTASIVTVYYS